MLRKATELRGITVTATDGAIGETEDFYFDDQAWVVRYLVVKTGHWLDRQHVLLSPRAVREIDLPNRQLVVNLTKEQVVNSPDIDTQKPVSRQHEAAFADHYGYPYYWNFPFPVGDPFYPVSFELPAPTMSKEEVEAAVKSEEKSYDPHLRSISEVTGYHLEAVDGEIGHVEDFMIDETDWAIRYLVVDTRNWLPGERVLVAPSWIERMSWEESKVFVNLLQVAVKQGPRYEGAALTREYEAELHSYYGKPHYWP
jgi:hypothetical protein